MPKQATSPVEDISTPSLISEPDRRSKEKTGTFTPTWSSRRSRRRRSQLATLPSPWSTSIGSTVIPMMIWVAVTMKSWPRVFEMKGKDLGRSREKEDQPSLTWKPSGCTRSP